MGTFAGLQTRSKVRDVGGVSYISNNTGHAKQCDKWNEGMLRCCTCKLHNHLKCRIQGLRKTEIWCNGKLLDPLQSNVFQLTKWETLGSCKDLSILPSDKDVLFVLLFVACCHATPSKKC